MKTRVLNIRNVPEEVYRSTKAQAAQAGITLQEFVIQVLQVATKKGK
jgi:predicted HicB family RNase H-like nuclease